MKDPFEAAVEEQESASESPVAPEEDTVGAPGLDDGDDDVDEDAGTSSQPSTSAPPAGASTGIGAGGKGKDDDDDDDEDHMDVEFGKLPSGAPTDPDKMAKMQKILSQFTEEQMSRYESFRRSGFQKSNMKRLLTSITGSQKISVPMTIVVSGIGKMLVGELIETSREVMTERKESGPIRPCHIREAYRRLKLEGKIPKRSVPRLFR